MGVREEGVRGGGGGGKKVGMKKWREKELGEAAWARQAGAPRPCENVKGLGLY